MSFQAPTFQESLAGAGRSIALPQYSIAQHESDEKTRDLLYTTVYALSWNREKYYKDDQPGWPLPELFRIKPLYQKKNAIPKWRKGKARALIATYSQLFRMGSDDRVYLTEVGKGEVRNVPEKVRDLVEKRFRQNDNIPSEVKEQVKRERSRSPRGREIS